ncbi:hypothetical protein [Brevibacterium luteolum]|uniref:Uncharacterized protein n=1 Tax=Brevibacterium luteolum TaxID=199591 RepID=A0A6G8KT87_9MICO|nr:hypothetical protein [Brevibacterium luteolum]QIN27876.1 hypothetical protein EW640_00175 [Brevibacterium luteolum]
MHTPHRTAAARVAAAIAVVAALSVPLTGAVPGVGGSAEASAVSTGASSPSVPVPSAEPHGPSSPPSPDESSIKGRSEYRKIDGAVQFVKSHGGVVKPGDLDSTFDCNISSFAPECSVDDDGFLIVAKSHYAEPASSSMPRAGERIKFKDDPQITFELGSDRKLKVTSDPIPLESLRHSNPPSPSPTATPTPTGDPTPSHGPTREPSPKPTTPPPHDDPPTDDDLRREPDPSEDDQPDSTAPPSSPEDPNSGNGRRSIRVPGQAGDDWAPTGDGSNQQPQYNYADPVPRAPDDDESATDDAISAEGSPGGQTERSAEAGADSADDDAADLASATGSGWAIGGLVGIAAMAIGLVVFFLGRSDRRRAH